MKINEVPDIDLVEEFDQTEWNSCIYGTYCKVYNVKLKFIKVYHYQDSERRFGFEDSVFEKIFFRGNHVDYTDYKFFANRALEVIYSQGYDFLPNLG